MKSYFKIILLVIIYNFFSGSNIAQTNGWKEIGIMKLFPVSDGQIVFNNSKTNPKFFILGGYSQITQSILKNIQVYDPIKNSWEAYRWEMKNSRRGFVAALWDSSIVYFGGSEDYNLFLESLNYPKEQEPFYSDNNLNFNRLFSSGLVIGDELYIISGTFPPFDKAPFVVVYNLKQKTITYNDNFPSLAFTYSGDASVFEADNQIYILGGIINKSVSNLIRRLDTVNKKIYNVSAASLLIPRGGAGATYLPASRRGIIVGGYDQTTKPLNSAEQILLKPDGSVTVSALPSLKYARRNPMVASYGNKVFVFGGQDEKGNVVNQIEMFTDTTTVTDVVDNDISNEFALEQNYPNPFNPETVIRYKVKAESFVTLKVHDVLGREVATLVNEMKQPGSYTSTFSIHNSSLSSGIYFYTLQAGKFIQTKKMLLTK